MGLSCLGVAESRGDLQLPGRAGGAPASFSAIGSAPWGLGDAALGSGRCCCASGMFSSAWEGWVLLLLLAGALLPSPGAGRVPVILPAVGFSPRTDVMLAFQQLWFQAKVNSGSKGCN